MSRRSATSGEDLNLLSAGPDQTALADLTQKPSKKMLEEVL